MCVLANTIKQTAEPERTAGKTESTASWQVGWLLACLADSQAGRHQQTGVRGALSESMAINENGCSA